MKAIMDETLRWAIGIVSTLGLAVGTVVVRAFSSHSDRLMKLETSFEYLADDLTIIKGDLKQLLSHHEQYRCPLVQLKDK